MANNKVVLGDGTTLMDITDTTATESDVAQGEVFYTASGLRAVGTMSSSSTLVAEFIWDSTTQEYNCSASYSDIVSAIGQSNFPVAKVGSLYYPLYNNNEQSGLVSFAGLNGTVFRQYGVDSTNNTFYLSTPFQSETVSASTMLASGWSNSQYSFETNYPNATYNLEIELNGDTATTEEIEAWSNAQILGSASSNVAIAKGDTPTIDLPIILKVVKK